MKKLFLYVFLGWLWCNVGFASGDLSGIKELYLAVEDVAEKGEKQCLVNRKDIMTSIKYIISNSKLKLSDDLMVPTLWFQPIILGNQYICSGTLNLSVHQHTNYSKHNSDGISVRGQFVFYYENWNVMNNTSDFRKTYLNAVEDIIKKLVVTWNEDNKQ